LDQYWNQTGKKQEFIRKRDGVKYPEYWIPAKTHKILDNIWTDIESYDYSTGYGTEKHVALLERIIEKFSKPNYLIADFFCGSGTTLVVANKMGRRWIGCDSSSMAIKTTRKRLADSNFKLLVS
jgi:DNA modification methylase